jgi:hypothetical protein
MWLVRDRQRLKFGSSNTMQAPAQTSVPRSAFDRTGGIVYFAQMVHKIRSTARAIYAPTTTLTSARVSMAGAADSWASGNVLIVGLCQSAMPKQIIMDSEHDAVTIDGNRIPGWISESARCGTCGASKVYHADHGTLFCPECNVWSEEVCGDQSCAFCKDRPSVPLPVESLVKA